MIFQSLSLIVWAACPPLFLYGTYRRIERLQYATALLFVILLIDLFIGLNTPNPDFIKVIAVTAP